MTLEKAIKILELNVPFSRSPEASQIKEVIQDIQEHVKPVCGGKSLNMAIKALEKQIPKKPDYEDYDAKCPVCGHEFENNVNDWGCSYCQGCGQKLDWSDMNG